MRRYLLLLAVFGMVFSACETNNPTEPTSKAPLKATVSKDVTVYGYFYNSCCDEWIWLEGTGNFIQRDNGSQWVVKSFSGTGSNGNTYTQQGTTTQTVTMNYNDQGQLEYHVTLNSKLISDSGCSFMLHITYQFTINANGEVVVSDQKYSTECL